MRNNSKVLTLQTHFNHRNELPNNTLSILKDYFSRNITIRNQTVLLNSINNTKESIIDLVSILTSVGVIPYYVYQMDMVKNAEHFRTKIADSIALEKSISGLFPGFYTPQFVVDLPGGGGKRAINHFERYVEEGKYYEYYSSINPWCPWCQVYPWCPWCHPWCQVYTFYKNNLWFIICYNLSCS